MDPLEEEVVYEQKMDEITALLEELVLDAMIVALENIRKRTREFNGIEPRMNDHVSF